MPARKRELIAPDGDDFIRRDDKGRSTGSGEVGRSLARDGRTKSKAIAGPAQGDKDDSKH